MNRIIQPLDEHYKPRVDDEAVGSGQHGLSVVDDETAGRGSRGEQPSYPRHSA